MRELERIVLLRVVDNKWMDHIDDMDQLRQGIGLRAYAQRDPVIEYKFEGMDMFDNMIESIKEDTVRFIMHANVKKEHKREQVAKPLEAGFAGEKDAQRPKRAEKVGRAMPMWQR